ncbi:MAG TPA: hypothetical protein VFH48_37275 [Chloroflexota bacterium]|nr:hypothetical protein [Chloroflexota bacterium]
MDEQVTDTLSDTDALEAETDDEAGLGDAAKKKGDGFIQSDVDF